MSLDLNDKGEVSTTSFLLFLDATFWSSLVVGKTRERLDYSPRGVKLKKEPGKTLLAQARNHKYRLKLERKGDIDRHTFEM